MQLKTIEWISEKPGSLIPGHMRIIDQTRLPVELVYLDTDNVREIWKAIKTLQVRGAPAIGVAGAMGIVAAIQKIDAADSIALDHAAHEAAEYLATSRPTAVNLFHALDRMRMMSRELRTLPVVDYKERMAQEAVNICAEDVAKCHAIGQHGADLLKDGQTILTHCNAGSLATAQFGTALAPVYVAREQGKSIKVFADETRPLLQGARLTAWELMQEGIDVTLICDNMAAHVMREGRIDAVLVGADRIAANGDAANKIGTYSVAVNAKHHQIPFYVLAPTTTFDLSLPSGDHIPIEHRDACEVTHGFGRQTAPDRVKVYSPAFDVTPADLITAIVCENGIAYPPFNESLGKLALMNNEGGTHNAQ